MEEFKTGDKVYIKSDYEKTVYNSYKIHSLNNTHAIIEIKNQGVLYKKIPLNILTKNKSNVVSSENIKKGDLVKCIINNSSIEKGIIIHVYKTFVLVLVGLSKKKVSKNRIIVLNSNN
tara:strand:+ start:316 stop:669 length:354 start_codon:yes stop_codon:yes gene_type:complete